MITLTKDMELGVPEIDSQHQELVNRLNSVISLGAKSVSSEETQRTLDFLGEYVIKHFNDEEALQRKSGYPKYEFHREQHQIFIRDYQKLKREFTSGGASVHFTLNLNNSIINWIVRHIKTVDVEFGKYYQSSQGA
jgi:hemerythrin